MRFRATTAGGAPRPAPKAGTRTTSPTPASPLGSWPTARGRIDDVTAGQVMSAHDAELAVANGRQIWSRRRLQIWCPLLGTSPGDGMGGTTGRRCPPPVRSCDGGVESGQLRRVSRRRGT
jgi:hypothetical protein